jgi:tetratricopeptide (TPR) repeat protein
LLGIFWASLIDLDNVENSVLVKNVIQQVKNYKEQLRKLSQRGGMKDSELKALEPQLPTWWGYELKAMKETDPNKKNEIYRKGLRAYPESFELCVNYANFLTIIGKDHDQAEKHYKKALELEPNDAAVNGNSQTFIAKSMGRNKSTISRELSRNTGVHNQLWGT